MTAIALDRATRPESLAWRRFKDAFRRHPTAIAGGVVLLLMILIGLTSWRRSITTGVTWKGRVYKPVL